jgi:isoleucyl-tRNA synthetase
VGRYRERIRYYKEDIGKSISKNITRACKKTVMRYTDVWNDLTEKMGTG